MTKPKKKLCVCAVASKELARTPDVTLHVPDICRKPALRFQYGKKKNGQFYWHIRARNGEIIAQGEGYKSKVSVIKVLRILSNEASTMRAIEMV